MDVFELDVFHNVVASAPIFSHRSDTPFIFPAVGNGISVAHGEVLTITHVQYQFLQMPDNKQMQRCIVTVS